MEPFLGSSSRFVGAATRERSFGLLERLEELATRAGQRDPESSAARLFGCVAALLGLGLLVQTSHAATTLSPERFLPQLGNQAALRALALLVVLGAARLSPARLRPCVPAATVGALLALVLCYVPGIGAAKNGSWRWIDSGLFSFQPSELARIVAILWVADRCVRLGPRVRESLAGVLPLLGMTGLFFVLIVCEIDLGGALLLACCLLATMFVGGASARHLAGALLPLMAGALALGWATVPYVRARIGMFLGQQKSGQVLDCLAAIDQGGWFGMGLGHGTARQSGVPYLESDFVFAQVGEELGWLGMLLVLGLYVALLWNGLQLVLALRDRYLALASFGLIVSIGLQAMVHVQVVADLAPPKGMTLPFLSHGGTSLLVSSLCAGLAIGSARSDRAESGAARRTLD
jgi:cell division protein FtsW